MVAGGPLTGLTCQALDPRPFRIGDRHHRQPRDADQRKVLEGYVCLDFGERDRPRKPLDRCDIHRDVLSARVLRIRIGVGQRLRDPDHRFLTTGVVVEDAVALLDGVKMLLRQRVPDAAPDRFLVLHERAESVVGRFFLHQPVHSPRIVASHVSGFGPLWLSLAATSLGNSWVKSGRQLTRLSKPSVKRRNTDASSLRLARAAPSLATLVYIRDLPVAALQQSKNEGGARP